MTRAIGTDASDAVTATARRGAPGRPRWEARLVLVLAAAALALAGVLLLSVGRSPTPPRLAPAHLGHLAFVQDDEIWVANGDGTDARRITDAGSRGRQASDPRWRGTTITFAELTCDTDGPLTVGVVTASGQAPRYVAVASSWPCEAPLLDVSPEGAQIAFLARGALQIVAIDGARSITLPPPDGYDAWDDSDLTSLAWDPSGNALLAGARSAGVPAPPDLFLVPVDGRPPLQLSSGSEPAYGASMSPDGAHIAFFSCHVQGAPGGCDARGYDLGVMARDGAGRRVLDETTAEQGWGGSVRALWSPDGTRIAYAYARGFAGGGVFLTGVDGVAPPARIADDGVPLDWSPDGSRILVDRQGVDAINVDGTGSTVLLDPQLGNLLRRAPWEWVLDSSVDPFDVPGG